MPISFSLLHDENLEDIIALRYNVFECWKAHKEGTLASSKVILRFLVPETVLTLIVGDTVQAHEHYENIIIADLIKNHLDKGGIIQCLKHSNPHHEGFYPLIDNDKAFSKIDIRYLPFLWSE
jgi:hypothetical protein